MACDSPECLKADSRNKAINNAKERAEAYMVAHGLKKRIIVQQIVNGAYTHCSDSDERLGNVFKEIDVILL